MLDNYLQIRVDTGGAPPGTLGNPLNGKRVSGYGFGRRAVAGGAPNGRERAWGRNNKGVRPTLTGAEFAGPCESVAT